MKRVGFLLNSQIFAAHHQRLDSIIVLHRCQLLRTSAGYLRWEKGGKTDVWFLLVADSQTGKSTKSTDGWTIEHYTTWVILCNTVFCCCAKSKVEEDGQQSTPVYICLCNAVNQKPNQIS